jgi:hypothetical protein
MPMKTAESAESTENNGKRRKTPLCALSDLCGEF